MKGASAIIATIVLLLIIIALAGFAFLYLSKMPQQASEQAEEEARQFVGDMTSFRVDQIDNGNLYIRNLDVRSIEGEQLALYVDNQPVNITAGNLTPGQTTLINISDGILPAGSYDFKITTRLIEKTETLIVPANNVVKDPSFGEGVARSDFDILLLIDKSWSMSWATSPTDSTQRIVNARNAAINFVDMTDVKHDNLSVASFSTTAALNQQLTPDKNLVKNKIAAINYVFFGSTAIGSGINIANGELTSVRANPNSKKIIILLSDGSEDMNSNPLGRANEAAAQHILIYTIGFGSGGDPMYGLNESLLKNISLITGGKYYFAATGPELNAVFTDIGQDIGLNWLKLGNSDIGSYSSSCSSPGICGKFTGSIENSALFQNVRVVLSGSYKVDASLTAMTSGNMGSGCAVLGGETCADNDARIRLLAFDAASNVIGNVTSNWASASGLMGPNRITKSWITPPNTKTVRFQIEPGSCRASCTVDAVYVDDAEMKISKP